MQKLAINGGKPVVSPGKEWPRWPIHGELDVRQTARVTRSDQWSYDGPTEWRFAEKFAKYLGAPFGACCTSGTHAIQLALEALGIGAYDEVIVPGLTWQATAAACLDVNAVPVFVDVEPSTWCLDVDQAEAAITERTKAIIVVHLYGCMADITKLQALCQGRGLFLIEDCAHQHGSFWNGQGVGTLGDVGCFSFQESKVLSSGEGGFNTCKDPEIFRLLYSLRNCGRETGGEFGRRRIFGRIWKPDPDVEIQSGNFRLTEWQAAELLCGLQRLPRQVAKRDANAQYLNKLLAQIPGILTMHRRAEVTQQSYFNFAFRIDPEELGVGNGKFCRALNAELGLAEGEDGSFEPPYEPLNGCALYKPHTKPRHRLSDEYWAAIDPSRFQLPVCEEAYGWSGVVVHQAILLGRRSDMDLIARAVAKVVENITEVQGLPD